MSNYERLSEIREEILDLVTEASKLIRGTDAEQRWDGYVKGHILSSCGSEDYPTYNPTFKNILDKLQAAEAANKDLEHLNEVPELGVEHIKKLVKKYEVLPDGMPDKLYEKLYDRLIDLVGDEEASKIM